MLLLSFSSSCQVTKNLSSNSIQKDLIDFLIAKGEIRDNFIKNYTENKRKIHVTGVLNRYSKDELINGIYVFSAPISHTRAYYLLVEDDKYTILDLSSKKDLDSSLSIMLDFCERQRYCSDFIEEYSKRMIGLYYRMNKNPLAGMDVNCENGLKDSNDLP